MNANELIEYLITPVAQVAMVIGLAGIAKELGMKKKYIPLLDLALGIISGIIIFGYTLGYGAVNGVIVGVAIGLSACGLFSGIKNVAKKEE